FSSRRRHTRSKRDWSSDVCSSDLFLLMEAAWELSMDDTGGPVHHEDLPAGKLLGLLQHRHAVVHVANAVQQRDRRGVLSAQQSEIGGRRGRKGGRRGGGAEDGIER